MIGIITKIDSEKADPVFSRKVLKAAGISAIFEISAYSGIGLEALKTWLEN
ncbi:EutP/PduV family microcompartment system protein [Endozoicomonas sp. SCSIO W0465]|uniref:EutP/PduV family microcompartment system protein n=1 Tax=Endozoicomonas sp. SCSIO W0465 TaxID=2918516 RepID=UPI0020753DF0|nr:EutP/PduV family microcompartment system protein [Endozoicomonas sp. SCSIO W0465]USE36061.1 EutP/PduV family microcompartment system protein [Endozoicomonas sp. SCSIO W0465]